MNEERKISMQRRGLDAAVVGFGSVLAGAGAMQGSSVLCSEPWRDAQQYSGLPCGLIPRLGRIRELPFLMSLILHWEFLVQSLHSIAWLLRSDTAASDEMRVK